MLRQASSSKSNGKRLGIIGKPGAGKTTLLRRIANWVADEISEAIVIWISLADLQGNELETYLFDSWVLAAIKRVGKVEATLCGTWQSLDGDLPDTKAKLYRRFVTTLYQWKKPHLNWIQQQELNAALGKLALSGMLNETDRFQLRESVGYRVMGASQFELAGDLDWLNLVARDAETAEGIYSW